MKYEYIAILFAENNNYPTSLDIKELNEKFNDGWEYVDSISQIVSIGGQSFGHKEGSITVILKREKPEVSL